MKKLLTLENEYESYFERYISQLPADTQLLPGYKAHQNLVQSFFENIPKSKLDFRYEKGKWSIKEIFQHLIDTERIFIYRCFRIARRDITPLAGYDQNLYIDPSNASNKTIGELSKEYFVCRQNSISILDSLSEQDLAFIGHANDSKMSARAAAFIILGHEIWHMNIIKERYLAT